MTEWCKKEACWDALCEQDITIPKSLEKELVISGKDAGSGGDSGIDTLTGEEDPGSRRCRKLTRCLVQNLQMGKGNRQLKRISTKSRLQHGQTGRRWPEAKPKSRRCRRGSCWRNPGGWDAPFLGNDLEIDRPLVGEGVGTSWGYPLAGTALNGIYCLKMV